MRIIDDKGRLFGKINLIDFLVLLAFIFIIPMSYFGYKLFNKPLPKIKEEVRKYINLEKDFKFIEIPSEISDLIVVGDKEINEKGQIIGEIIWLGESKPYEYKIDLGKGEVVNHLSSELKEILVRLKVNTELINNNLFYKNKQIMIDSPIEFKTAKYTLSAVPIEEEKKTTEEIDLNVILKNLSEDELAMISIGDKELDKNGDVIAEILKIGKKENDTYEINLGRGTFVRGEDSTKKQLSIKMRLKCQLADDNQLYFKGNSLTNDSWLEFNADKYFVKGKIAMIYESTPILLKTRRVQLVVKFTGIIPEVAKIIQEGDTETDQENKVVAKLKTIISNKPSDVLVLKEDRWITLTHPFQKDVLVILEMFCIEKEGILYFKNYPVKIGNMITFVTDLYSIQGIIIGLEGG